MQTPSPPRDAATVVLLRAAAAGGFETYLVKRARTVDFMAGAHVFPGGRLDKADSSPSACALLSADVAALCERLGEAVAPAQAAGLFIAAIRETFEEAGVLLGRLGPGWTATDARRAAAEGALFVTLVERLDAAELVPWVRWVTPEISPKRYEATEGVWIAPSEAVERWHRGEILLPPATAKSLDALAAHRTVEEALAAAARRPPPVMMPTVWNEDGRAYISLPGDPRHPVAEDPLGGRILRLRLETGRYLAVRAN